MKPLEEIKVVLRMMMDLVITDSEEHSLSLDVIMKSI